MSACLRLCRFAGNINTGRAASYSSHLAELGALRDQNEASSSISEQSMHDELKRQAGFSVGKIQVNQKKKLRIRTPSSPPRVISAGSMNTNSSSFDEHVSIQCILFADGSFWENPARKGISCEKLRILQRGPVKSSNEITG